MLKVANEARKASERIRLEISNTDSLNPADTAVVKLIQNLSQLTPAEQSELEGFLGLDLDSMDKILSRRNAIGTWLKNRFKNDSGGRSKEILNKVVENIDTSGVLPAGGTDGEPRSGLRSLVNKPSESAFVSGSLQTLGFSASKITLATVVLDSAFDLGNEILEKRKIPWRKAGVFAVNVVATGLVIAIAIL